jgi:hypothetical protein
MPCYANLMYPGHWGAPPLLGRARDLLDDPDDRPARPVRYWLWRGPFEAGGDETADAWRETTAEVSKRRLRRLLEVSGPVPWRLKGPLLDDRAPRHEWHSAVRAAIEGAGADCFGEIDPAAAARLLEVLGEPP